MALDSEFIAAVDSGNRLLVRVKLENIIVIDPTLQKFREMKTYAERHMPDLYDPHKGDLKNDTSAWTKDYYNEQKTELSFNFSCERLQLLCDMAGYLYKDRINIINEKRKQEDHRNAAQKKRICLTMSGALTAGIGAIAKAPVIAGIGIAAFAVGVILLVKESVGSK